MSSTEAARHLGISDSAVRKRGANGQIERRERDAGGPGRGWEYWLEDAQVDDTVAIESAVGESGVEMLAEAIQKVNETTAIQQDAIATVREVYEGRIETERERSRELRERIAQLEAENAGLREEMREDRNRERERTERLDAYVRELRERNRSPRWMFWKKKGGSG